jgi:hypothetical protein
LERLGGLTAIVACMAVFLVLSLAIALNIRGRAHIVEVTMREARATA